MPNFSSQLLFFIWRFRAEGKVRSRADDTQVHCFLGPSRVLSTLRPPLGCWLVLALPPHVSACQVMGGCRGRFLAAGDGPSLQQRFRNVEDITQKNMAWCSSFLFFELNMGIHFSFFEQARIWHGASGATAPGSQNYRAPNQLLISQYS